MHEIQEWVEAAIVNQGVEIVRLSDEAAQAVVVEAMVRYVRGRPEQVKSITEDLKKAATRLEAIQAEQAKRLADTTK